MNFDVTTIILFGVAAVIGIAYFARRSARVKRIRRQL